MISCKITIKGIVQGVGFRPFVYREACRYGIRGFVCNTPEGVVIEAHGELCEPFINALRENLPERARIDSMVIVLRVKQKWITQVIAVTDTRLSIAPIAVLGIPLSKLPLMTVSVPR